MKIAWSSFWELGKGLPLAGINLLWAQRSYLGCHKLLLKSQVRAPDTE